MRVATAGGLVALACAWTLVCVITFTRILEGVERNHGGRNFDEAHPGWASRDGGRANSAIKLVDSNARPRRLGPFEGGVGVEDRGGVDPGHDAKRDCYPTCDPDAQARLDRWLGNTAFNNAMASPPILPKWTQYLSERNLSHVAGGADFHGEWDPPVNPHDTLNHWLGHTKFKKAMRGDMDGDEFDPHRLVWVKRGEWMAGGDRAGEGPPKPWTVAAKANADGGDPEVLRRMDERVGEYQRSHGIDPKEEAEPEAKDRGTAAKDWKKPARDRRRDRVPFAGRIRVVISATPQRREHLTKALLPALRDDAWMESRVPLDVVVSTSDAQLCALLKSENAPMSRCVTHVSRRGASLVPEQADYLRRIPGDSRERFEWYWRETVDAANALTLADTTIGSGAHSSMDSPLTLFLEDDVIPTKRWEAKLRALIAPYAGGKGAEGADTAVRTSCDFDMFVLYTEGKCQVKDGERGRFVANTQAMLFCPGMAARVAEALLDRLGDAPPDWLIRDISFGPVDDGDEPDDGAVGAPPRPHVVRFANPSLFQHGCERSTSREKGTLGASGGDGARRRPETHRSKSFREPAIGCVRHGREHR